MIGKKICNDFYRLTKLADINAREKVIKIWQ